MTATVVALGLAAGPAAAVTQPRAVLAVDGDVDCSVTAASEADASALAAACGKTVEVVDARTEYDTLYAQADGSMRLEVSSLAVRTQVGGQWRPIDTAVVAGEGRIEVVAPATEMSFSDGSGNGPLVRMVKDGHEFTMDVPFDLPKPVLSGDTVTYPEVLDGVDLIVTVNADGTGISEVLRVEDADAAANPELASLALPVQVSEGLSVTEGTDGAFAAVDDAGAPVFEAEPALMWDSSAQASAAPVTPPSAAPTPSTPAPVAAAAAKAHARLEGPVVGDEVAEMEVALAEDAVVLTPDAAMLADPDTVFPVYIDPAVGSGSRSEWMAVRSNGGGVAHNFAVDEGVGFCNTAQLSYGYCDPYTFTSRLMWEFSGLTVLPALKSTDLISAVFTANGTNAYSCTPSAIQLYRVNDFSSNTTFATAGPWTSDRLVQAHVTTHRPGCADVNARPRPIEFNIMDVALDAVNNGRSALWVGLKADVENNMVGWKRYAAEATLSIVYNRPPDQPMNLTITGNNHTWTCPNLPSPSAPLSLPASVLNFTAVGTDPDGGNLRANINGYSTAGTLIWNPLMTTGRPSGAAHTVPLDLRAPSEDLPEGGAGRSTFAEGTTYYWDVDMTDDNPDRTLWSAKSRKCYFRPDYTPPAPPDITLLTQEILLGQPVKFQVTSPSTDVTRFTYSLNSEDLGASVTAGKVIEVIPMRTGDNVLWVAAEDGAYNTSAGPEGGKVPVTFTVPATRSGQWHLDEGDGATAFDSIAPTAAYQPHPLTLSSGVTRTDGPWGSQSRGQGWPADKALFFDSSSDTAVASGPVVDTKKSFTVAAVVMLDSIPAASATAVSQDGAAVSGFSLGYRSSSSCPTGTGGCWSFFMHNADLSDTPVQVASDVEVTADEWVALIGVYDAQEHALRLNVCELQGDQNSSRASTPFTSTWNATGAFRLGAGKFYGSSARPFPGAVGTVRTYPGALPDNDSEIGDFCNNGF